MNDEQINEYMQALLSGKRKVGGLLENEALNHFRDATTQIAHGRQRAQQLTTEAEQIRNAVQQLIGQQTAYSQLLMAAEDARRDEEEKKKKSNEGESNKKPLSLVELRDKMGADKVEVTDTEGNVLASIEGESTSTDETEAPVPEEPEERETCQK